VSINRIVIMPVTPAAQQQIGRLQGDRQQSSEKLNPAAHRTPTQQQRDQQIGI
jgi:hypothetical protein